MNKREEWFDMKKAIQIPYNSLFEKKCEFAKKAGFKHIAVNFYEMLGKNDSDWASAVTNIERILNKNDIECIQCHPYYYDLLISSEIIEDECEYAIKQAIIASAKLGSKWSTLHPRSSVSTGFRTSASLEDNKKVFSEYLECALKNGTGIAVENLPIFSDVIPIMPFYSSDFYDLATFVDIMNDDKCKICWDFGHANLMYYNQAETIEFLGERIVCTHVHNNNGREDQHFPPECGNIKWNEVIPALAKTGYKGALTLETHCAYTDDDILESFAKYNFDCLKFIEKFK